MKTKKAKLMIFLLALTVLCALFAACAPEETPLEGLMTIVVRGETDITYKVGLAEAGFTSANTVLDAMIYLAEKNDGFSYSGSESAYGFQVSSIGGLTPAPNEFIEILTSVEKDFGVWVDARSAEYNGVALTSAGVGVSQLSLQNGAIIMFTLTVVN